jgi:SSS family transporter
MRKSFFVFIAACVFYVVPIAAHGQSFTWNELPPVPDALGLGGPFAGVDNDALIVAGGANFPDGAPWENGRKVWYADIHVLESGSEEWLSGFSLPHPLAYGVSVPTSEGLYLIGGSNSDKIYDSVYILKWDSEKKQLSVDSGPKLPAPSAFHAGAKIGDVIYIAAGHTELDSTTLNHSFWALDLSVAVNQREWRSLTPWPGEARIKAVGAAQQDGQATTHFYLFSGEIPTKNAEGGTDLRYMTDGFRYDPASDQWEEIAPLEKPVAAGTALPVGPTHVLVFSGSTGEFVTGRTQDHPEFPKTVLAYHTITDTWAVADEMPQSVVTTMAVQWGSDIIIPSGEIKPGIRTPKVQRATVKAFEERLGAANGIVLVLYLAALLGMGFYFSKREKGTDDFFLAGGRVPWWAAGLSIYATQLSAITFVSVPAVAYAGAWVVFPGSIMILLFVPIIIAFYLPFFRRLNITSAYEYLELRFNSSVRLFGSASFVVFQILRMAIVVYLPALGLTAITGIDVYVCIILMGVLSTAYTILGGIEAVIWTDVLQSVVLVGGLLLSVVLVFVYEGGISAVLSVASEENKFQLFQPGWSVTEMATWSMLLGTLMLQFGPYTTDQAVIQRYLTTKDEASAAKGIWLNGLMAVPFLFLFYLLGTCLYIYFKNHPELLAVGMQNDQVFPLYIAERLPLGVSGLVIAGIFAASMSSLDSSMHSVATALTTDFYKKFLPGTSDEQQLRFARRIVLVMGVFAVAAASMLVRFDISSLFFFFQSILGLLSSGVVGIFILGIFTTRSNSSGVLGGAAASIAVLVYLTWFTSVHFYLYAVAGIATCVIVGYGLSLYFPGTKKDLAGLTWYSMPEK